MNIINYTDQKLFTFVLFGLDIMSALLHGMSLRADRGELAVCACEVKTTVCRRERERDVKYVKQKRFLTPC